MKILLLSAYHAQSHQSWCNSMMLMFPDYDWALLSLPARYFNWRVRGNALSWSIKQRKTLQQDYDLVLATSMVDCATLRGLVPSLSSVPWVVYFHENQFAYPVESQYDHVEPKMVSLYNALCAEKIIFNSDYNRETFMRGLGLFLKKMPDEVPENTLNLIEKKIEVLAVPINVSSRTAKKNNKVPVLLWNHRWEYDKGPLQLLNVLTVLKERGFKFKLNLLGQKFRNTPNELAEVQNNFTNEIINKGYIESLQQYYDVVKSSDFVLSTALHDFQGLSLLEAVALGCAPIVPNRLAYTDIFPEYYRYASSPSEIKDESCAMADKIISLWREYKQINIDDINVERFSRCKMKAEYSKALFSI